jgi:hypothetical protein
VLADQPVNDGGQDTAATPMELLVAALASCVAFYAGRCCGTAWTAPGWRSLPASPRPKTGPPGSATCSCGSGCPAASRRSAGTLLAVASHCTVHNTLRQEPEGQHRA